MFARAGAYLEEGKWPWNKLKNELWGLVLDVSAYLTCASEVILSFLWVAALATLMLELISERTFPDQVSLEKDRKYKMQKCKIWTQTFLFYHCDR